MTRRAPAAVVACREPAYDRTVPRGLVASAGGPALAVLAALSTLAGCGDSLHPSPDAATGVADLQFMSDQMAASLLHDDVTFLDTDCEVVEHCVGAPGHRFLLRFDTVSANRGTADVFVGVPPPPGESNDVFEWSPCHKHHHVRNYASYELSDPTGVVLTARKQSFCLQDTQAVQPGIASSDYTCLRQGITRGWADVYDRQLPCQWIDVTGLPPGPYTLRIVVNPLHTLPESNYDNNEFIAAVQL